MSLPFGERSTLDSFLMEAAVAVGFFASPLLLLVMLLDMSLSDFKNALPPEPPSLIVDEDGAFPNEDACVGFVAAAGGNTAAAIREAAADTRPALAIAAVDILPVKLAPSSRGEEPVRAFFPSSFSGFSDGFGRLGMVLVADCWQCCRRVGCR